MSVPGGGEMKVEAPSAEIEQFAVVDPLCSECDIVVDEKGVSVFQAFQHGNLGVPITNQTNKLKMYPNVFIASDAVTWLQGKLGITRKDACEVAQTFLDDELFSIVRPKGKTVFLDGSYYCRLARYDVSERYTPADVSSSEVFKLSIHGFKGCPFCVRAIAMAKALEEEINNPDILVVEGIEHENRVAFTKWLVDKRNELSKNYAKVAFHSTSPIVYTTDTLHYIGGLDEMITFLHGLPQFETTRVAKEYKLESPISTFFKGIPDIARNWKSTLPF